MRAAVWAMVLGAVVSVAQTLLLFTELDVLREAMYEGARSSESGVDDPTFNDPAFDTFVDIMVVVIVAGTCLITLVVVGLWVWMALANARGRSWARVTASVLGGINLAMCLLNLAFVPLQEMSPEFVGPSPGTSAVGVALTVLYAAVSALALLLLWLPSSTTYVRAVTAQTRWETWSARWGRSAPATG